MRAELNPHAVIVDIGSQPAIARGQVCRVQDQADDDNSQNDAQRFSHIPKGQSETAG